MNRSLLFSARTGGFYQIIYLFIWTCTSAEHWFFTNAPQRPEQMSINITITIVNYMSFAITIQLAIHPSTDRTHYVASLWWSIERDHHSCILSYGSNGPMCSFKISMHPSTDRVQCCFTSTRSPFATWYLWAQLVEPEFSNVFIHYEYAVFEFSS
jgi:hypothetical protein